MKKVIGLAILLLVFTSIFSGAIATNDGVGPAPDSGDGFPDSNPEIRTDAPGLGGAPNSGDGDSDGSGF